MADFEAKNVLIKAIDALKGNPRKSIGVAIFGIAILAVFIVLFLAKPSSSGKFERIFLSCVFGFVGLALMAEKREEGPTFSLMFILFLLVVACIFGAILFPVFGQA